MDIAVRYLLASSIFAFRIYFRIAFTNPSSSDFTFLELGVGSGSEDCYE